ncbi:MAG: hypothetical protein JOZ05_09620 [Acetobacteraceae bacterium]|nr:hypothetical protein [Acetobacteraceae bacterium]
MDNGAINAQGGTLVIEGTVSGAGTIGIGAGATLALTSSGALSTAGVTFSGANGTLEVLADQGAVTQAGLISGFAPGDTIAIEGLSGPLAVSYQPTIAGYGRLILSSGSSPVGTLNLQGDFSGYRFVTSATTNGVAQITISATSSQLVGSAIPDTYSWIAPGSGIWSDAANWQDVTTATSPAAASPGAGNDVLIAGPSGSDAAVIAGPGDAGSLTLRGNITLAGTFTSGSLDARGDTQVVVGTGAALAVSGDVLLADARLAAAGGRVTAGSLTVTGGTLRADASSLLQIGAGSPLGTGIVIAAGATLTVAAGQLEADVTGSGTLSVGTGLTDVSGTLGGPTVAFTAEGAVLEVHGVQGATAVTGMQFGDGIDLAGITGATLAGNTVTAGGGTLNLAPAPSGYVYKLYGDAKGGTALLLDPTSPPAGAISITDASGNSTRASGDDYSGPVDYLQRQYIWSGSNGVAIAATVPNAFLKGGPGDDALAVQAGNNVLDGGTGSNFLMGASGSDGGQDTFFLDARGGGVTWSTIVNFHPGDMATIFGFNANSTRPLTASDGVGGYTGVTIHSEIAGAGTGVTASMTFAGIDQATAAAHFVYSSGTLPGNIGYLLIQYL